jgi:hypothetical protein
MKWQRYWQRQQQQQRQVLAAEEVALDAAALEELAQEAAQDVGMGARMEAASHHVPTAERMGSTSLMTGSCYQQHKPDDCFLLPANVGKKPENFIDG